ncbi:hypothetical protein GCM10010278_85010 [Streptomyces melanogenes]|nr:hypothetical protein GCM10010278_85010 [Streptomyces melanogenes]
MDQLWEDEGWQEYIFTGGTSTVLDLVNVVEPTDAGTGPFVRPLTDGEVRAWAPDGQPTHAQWAKALESPPLSWLHRAAFPGISLAGDGSSGSTNPSRRCRDCLPLGPASPGPNCPQPRPDCYDNPAVEVSHLTRFHGASWRPNACGSRTPAGGESS